MSKKFKNKMCVYCGEAKSATADHVFSRELLLKAHRGDLPKVPACESCNHEKSVLEHYVSAILPFGVSPLDFELGNRCSRIDQALDFTDDKMHGVYVGRVPVILFTAQPSKAHGLCPVGIHTRRAAS